MWVPRIWDDVTGLIGVAEESDNLDFKRELPPAKSPPANQEVAKDIAAMSVAGGLLFYGIAENPKTLVASQVLPVVLAGARERFQQIAGTWLAPGCVVEVVTIANPDDPAVGVVVVAVPPSSFAPHMVDGHYPVRRGQTTALLTETDVARLYERRTVMLTAATESPSQTLRHAFVSPRGEDGRRDAGTSVGTDVGQVRMVFLPVGPVAHPRAPWLRDALRDAHARAYSKVLPLISDTRPAALHRLADWSPYDAVGWTAGKSTSNPFTIERSTPAESSHAAVFAYPGRLSFQSTKYLRVDAGSGNGVGLESYLCAFEQSIATSMLVFTAIAGEIFAEMDAVGMVHIVIELVGFADAISDGDASSGLWGEPEYSRMLRAPISYLGAELTDLTELRNDPLATAQRLIDPWLAAFCSDASVWSRISSSGTPA
jgi:hypothetical protein